MTVTNQYYEFDPDFDPGSKVRSDAVNLQFQAIQNAFDFMPDSNEAITTDTSIFAPESGAGNAYVVTMPDTRLSNQDGDGVRFFATHANTGAATIDVDGIGAVAFTNWDGSAFVGTEIISGNIYEIRFDAANARYVLAATLDADLNRGYASEWAITPEDTPVSVAAGGDGVNDFSALHWAAKSQATSSAIQISGTPVNNQLAIWTADDTIEGDSKVTFSGFTFAVAETAFGSSQVRLSTDGSVRYVGYYGAHATLGVDYSDDFVMTFSAACNVFRIAGGRDVRIGDATFQDYGQFQHDGTFFNFSAHQTTGLKIRDVPLYLEERAADGGAVAAFGQVWVRDDVPNVLMYTDDTGVDFVISSTGAGISGTPVNNQIAIWTGANEIEGDPELTWDGQIFTIAPAATDEPEIRMIDANGAVDNTEFRMVVDSSGMAWRFQALLDGGASGGDAMIINRDAGSVIASVEFPTVTIFNASSEVRILDDRVFIWGSSFDANMKYDSADNMLEFNTGAGAAGVRMSSGIRFQIAGQGNEELVNFHHDETDLNVTGTNTDEIHFIGIAGLRQDGVLHLGEQAAAEADTAAYGQVWVRDDAPNILMFTDDTGDDFEITNNARWQFVEQVGDDTVNNTTTLIDTDLLLTNIPIGRYSLLMVVNARDVAVSGCGMRTDISTTGIGGTSVLRGAVKNFSGSGPPTTDLQGILQDVMLFPSLSTGSGTDQIYYTGTLDVTSGTNSLQVEFAQENAQVGDLDFESGSFLALTKLD